MAKTPAQRAAKHGDKAVPGPAPLYPPVPAAVNPSAQGSPAAARSNGYLIVIAGVVASAFLFWYFHLLTLNQLTQLSNGQAMPDSMLFGFDTGYIQGLKSAMDSDALGQLQYVHKTAGTLFPLVFAFSWLLLIGLNTAKRSLRWVLWAAPALFAVVQLCANVAVDSMLSHNPVDGGQVALASMLVVSSWVLLLLSLLASGVALWGSRRKQAQLKRTQLKTENL
ncbi:hypothetical protein FHU41_002630 [Psychromicrobium silvestre]|uniref:Uncharacterized protein n=1 Tax=Psychromicrobium silvestre TaxID=1645614 RepID=A0A7Y9S8E5_9MICC|nr:hypothetical protein [Psychromicrobium silvestre]NYE96380.1 hypothetical protein [Psychromicrobium silvestre]